MFRVSSNLFSLNPMQLKLQLRYTSLEMSLSFLHEFEVRRLVE